MNRVTVTDDAKKPYDLEVENDTFWKRNALKPFPEAIEDNSNEVATLNI
jgi:hypothetical protein